MTLPSGTSTNGFLDWVGRLPEREAPTWLGLPPNAEKLLLVGHADRVVGDLRRVVELLDEGESVMADAEGT